MWPCLTCPTATGSAVSDIALCAIALVIGIGILSGCGSDTPASTTPTTTVADTQTAVEPPPPSPKNTSAARRRAIDGIISDYLSKIIDVPSSVRDPATATPAMNKLVSEVRDASRQCKTAVLKVSKVIDRTNLSGAAKRKRVLDSMLPVYGDC